MQIVLDAVDTHVLFCFHCTGPMGIMRDERGHDVDFGKYRRAGTVFVAITIEGDTIMQYWPFDLVIAGALAAGPVLWLPWAFLHFMHTPHLGPIDLVDGASDREPDLAASSPSLAARLLRDPSSWAAKRLRDPSRRRGRQEVQALLAQKSRFCLFLYKNCWAYLRSVFFKRLSQYRFVHAPGVCEHNVNDTDVTPQFARGSHLNSFVFDDRIELLPKYKFVISFDNAEFSSESVNEKIPNTWLGGAVPIYLGASPRQVDLYFNPRAFVHVHSEGDFDAKIELIKYLDGNDTAYAEMLAEPIVLGSEGRLPAPHHAYRSHADYFETLAKPCGAAPPHALDNAVSDRSAMFGKTWNLNAKTEEGNSPSLYELVSDVVDCEDMQ